MTENIGYISILLLTAIFLCEFVRDCRLVCFQLILLLKGTPQASPFWHNRNGTIDFNFNLKKFNYIQFHNLLKKCLLCARHYIMYREYKCDGMSFLNLILPRENNTILGCLIHSNFREGADIRRAPCLENCLGAQLSMNKTRKRAMP